MQKKLVESVSFSLFLTKFVKRSGSLRMAHKSHLGEWDEVATIMPLSLFPPSLFPLPPPSLFPLFPLPLSPKKETDAIFHKGGKVPRFLRELLDLFLLLHATVATASRVARHNSD